MRVSTAQRRMSSVLLPLLMAPLLLQRGSAFLQWAKAVPRVGANAGAAKASWTRARTGGAVAMSTVQAPKGYVSPETRLQEEEQQAAKKPWDYTAFHPSYKLIRQDEVNEYGAKVAIYEHKKSGAQVMSVGIADENKVSHLHGLVILPRMMLQEQAMCHSEVIMVVQRRLIMKQCLLRPISGLRHHFPYSPR